MDFVVRRAPIKMVRTVPHQIELQTDLFTVYEQQYNMF